ncbi:MAG: flavodoxin family protein [Erysipelotrichaceae bacterium]
MKIVLLNGSPRINGCTHYALEQMVNIFKSQNIETVLIQLGSKPYRGCIGCGKCRETKACIFDDGVNEIYQQMKQADAIVVGAPVYFASPTGSIISVLDRIFSIDKPCFAHKPAAAIVSARRAGTSASLDVLTKYFSIAQMPIVSSSYWPMVHGNSAEEVSQDIEGIQTVEQLARNMVWMMQLIQLGKENHIMPPVQQSKTYTNFIR